ncbi:MAG: hypothetical protein Q8R81_01225 [Novosphingobium sp.]|uniref:hypothetical protein n=1 Tax=Novosphingobium sp. TaxID=1874826 RepID=UPI00273338F2|nr:hypothetical protein [Novosphingobium sp.]MDP3548997.1 hypothetical protein [Novosphingobium sp.]
MQTITIHDLHDERNVLAFDLRDLLALLAPTSLEAEWTVADPACQEFFATGEGGAALEKLAAETAMVSGKDLLALANETQQVIWGDFRGAFENRPGQIWTIIRAVDSSFYEITTSDGEVIEKVQGHFNDVRFAE